MKLNIARSLLVVGFLVGLESLLATFSHIGDPLFMISADHQAGASHAWYHALREAMGDVAAIACLLLVFFMASHWRMPVTWWICLVLLVGYYAPFWIGMPFNPALAAPDLEAEIRHIIQAALPFSALFVARAEFMVGHVHGEPAG